MEQKSYMTISRANDYKRLKEHSRRRSPKKIITEGIILSTGIQDAEKLQELAEKAMRAEMAAQENNHDVFLFGIAESIDSIKNGTSSENEYFEWIAKARSVMLKMTDGTVTVEDITARNEFIERSYQRETELLVCLALYERSNHPLAKERYTALKLKLQRLRQLRSLLKSSTKSRADENVLTPEEKVRMAQAVRTLDEMEEDDEKASKNKAHLLLLRQLELMELNDAEFYQGYSFYTRMLEDQRDVDFSDTRGRMLDLAERLGNLRHQEETKEQIYERIQRLRGAMGNSKDEQSVRSKSSFNAELFYKLRGLTQDEIEKV